ncbi:hypothetical protein [Oceanobacillus timonensis]|uniref:hypothetical protein n=1 Tax=Oceanobacillus timonensis TaxID=1926285 RepID=UPI0009BB5D9B|nr:hypothetical protein [Oceanobacillus timonensis]
MKKSLQIIGLLCMLAIVSACQSDTEQEVNHQDNESEETAQENESDVAGDVSEESEDESDHETAANEGASANYQYEEQEIIEEQIEEGEYDVVVETDNPGSRVMFYEIDGEKYYKTVFVKDENRLKIIDIQKDDEQGLVYNEII